ncbi:MAG TPA: CHAD domain-containing protein [Verrucomicrobiae bacterium]|nr:CHAD domain-containing protein [Verrucomicrobiae bacterium]
MPPVANNKTGSALARRRLWRCLAELPDKQWERWQEALKRCRRKCGEKRVHKLRVESRRLLALIELLGDLVPASHPKRVRRPVKCVLDNLSRLRDTQTMLRGVERDCVKYPALTDFRDHLCRDEKRITKNLPGKLHRSHASKIKDCLGEFRKETRPFLREARKAEASIAPLVTVVNLSFQRVLKRRARSQPDNFTSIHCTRIAFKKFRYLVELLAPLTGGVTAAQCDALREHQDLMGNIQDDTTLLRALDKFGRKHRRRRAALRKFRATVERRRAAHIRRYFGAEEPRELWPTAWHRAKTTDAV